MSMDWGGMLDPRKVEEALERAGLIVSRTARRGRKSCLRFEKNGIQGHMVFLGVREGVLSLGFHLPVFGRVILHIRLHGNDKAVFQVLSGDDVGLFRSELDDRDSGGEKRKPA